ncbi:MAG: hypothetical protein RL758_1621 [Pseudomonadota bacterium]|jgi:hypothetical protein
MSLPVKAIDRLFERMAATYGAQWTRMWATVPMPDVKSAWAHELSGYANRLDALAWALEHLPERCPNVIEFRNLCRQAPSPQAPRLPEPQADPQRVAAELAKLGDVRRQAAEPSGGKAWAHRVLAAFESGQRVSYAALTMARQAAGRG